MLNQSGQKRTTKANPSVVCLSRVLVPKTGQPIRNRQTLVFVKSENRWVNGWKKVSNLRPNLWTLKASSWRLGLTSGPSRSSFSISKFHLVWSLVSMTLKTRSLRYYLLLYLMSTNLGLKKQVLEVPVIHMHADVNLILFHLTLPTTNRLLNRVGSKIIWETFHSLR